MRILLLPLAESASITNILQLSLLLLFPWNCLAEAPTNIIITHMEMLKNQSLMWGPYNPSLYLGMRPRIPASLFTGMLWSRVEDFQSPTQTFRHTCEQNDNMAGYGWEEYDLRAGGSQVIRDQGNKIDIETHLVKIPGGQHGGNWGIRIKGKLRNDAPSNLKTTMVFYTGLMDSGNIVIENNIDPKGLQGPVTLSGSNAGLGNFKLEITTGPSTNRAPARGHPELEKERDLSRTFFQSFTLPMEQVWRAKEILFYQFENMAKSLMARFGAENHPPPWETYTLGNQYAPGNLQLVQKVFEGPFEFDVLFSSGSASKAMTSDILTQELSSLSDNFVSRFESIFVRKPPFDTNKYEKFARTLFSNLLGGIGFFHGSSVVDRTPYAEDEENFWEEAKINMQKGVVHEEGPSSLFTSIPSRPFFPRGFLWDEGFHLIPIIEWDTDLALEIVRSWFSLIDEDGWIAREQILGLEARSKVPKEFQTQYPHYANPPTLFFILQRYIDMAWQSGEKNFSFTENTADQRVLGGGDGIGADLYSTMLKSPENALHYLRTLYPSLRRYYYWFRETQKGEVRAFDREAFSSKEAYRWRGRAPGYCLTSGLDDYPRAEPPHTGELHVDLISWMAMMTRAMRKISTIIGEDDDSNEYARFENAMVRNIDDLHWSQEHKTYCDATVDENNESIHVCHKGYLSLFPFMLGLLARDSEKIGPILDMLADPEQMWSPYGIRSISKQDEFYSKGENYWRGPIWVNINYLILKNLLDLGSNAGPHQERATALYKELRFNLVDNVFKVWEKTGFAWEQYEQETGNAKGVQHFLGWTSLVVSIMCMPETPPY